MQLTPVDRLESLLFPEDHYRNFRSYGSVCGLNSDPDEAQEDLNFVTNDVRRHGVLRRLVVVKMIYHTFNTHEAPSRS